MALSRSAERWHFHRKDGTLSAKRRLLGREEGTLRAQGRQMYGTEGRNSAWERVDNGSDFTAARIVKNCVITIYCQPEL